MKPDEQERIFLARAREILEQDIEALDDAAVSRLRKMRRAALEHSGRGGMGLWKLLRVPAAALAVASIVIIAVNLHFKSPVEVTRSNSIEDMEILVSGDPLDMMMELDFYAWLAMEEKNAG